jgi:hypothetical protein
MMNVHIYTAPMQSATHYFDDKCEGKENHFWIDHAAHRLLWCWNCRQRRWAKNLFAQVFYDSERFWCKPGTGCRVKVSCPYCKRDNLIKIKGRLYTESINPHKCKQLARAEERAM